ncbi:CHASE2 domain-containing protein [bacterium BMS3Abin03]|nr:CHASE2 domain-containing protein [bacterium BMS3Abin03]
MVLIGISDPQIANTIETTFNNHLPGVALHAFALDNLLKHRWLRKDLFVPSASIFILSLIGFVFIQSKSKKPFVYLVFFSTFLTIGFILFTFLNYTLAFSFFIIPFLFLVITDL